MTVPDITDKVSGGLVVSFSLFSAAEYAWRADRVRARSRPARSAGQVSKQRVANRGMIQKNNKFRFQVKNIIAGKTAWAQFQDLLSLMETFNATNEMLRQLRFDATDGSGVITLNGHIEGLTVPITGGANITHIDGELDFVVDDVVTFA
ncbi:MAG: hypothetical protein V3U54_12960 [Thermodesulfobacteriota bacterium]